MDYGHKYISFNELIGLTMKRVERVPDSEGDHIEFDSTDGRSFRLGYIPDCCAMCEVDDISGELAWLVGTPITAADEASNSTDPPRSPDPGQWSADAHESTYLWSFYHFATKLGDVTIRFYGSTDHGYYSESASLVEVIP